MRAIAVEWAGDAVEGRIEVRSGTLAGVRVTRGTARVSGAEFATDGPCRLKISIGDEQLSAAANPTMITFRSQTRPFTVLLRDISSAYPVWIPPYDVIVTDASDDRSFARIVEAIRSHGGQTQLQAIDAAPEESFDAAASAARQIHGATWLGISRDIRVFELSSGYDNPIFTITPRRHGYEVPFPKDFAADGNLQYSMQFGKGIGPVHNVTRHLEDGALPILHTTLVDEDVTYHSTAFVSLERSPLTLETLRGTHFLVADVYGRGHMLTEAQEAQYDALKAEELQRDEETVLYCRIRAVNHSSAPRYAWFRAPSANFGSSIADGMGTVTDSGAVYMVAELDGIPLPKAEVAVLLPPGGESTLEFRIPHQPISKERAEVLFEQSFATRCEECRAYWLEKLASVAQIRLPERRIDEMVRAGLLHLDLVAYGLEPDGPVAASIGWYCPIGSESSPIIQFFDSMGWHKLAERSLDYFLEKQRDDGFIQNYGGYMLETGPALWTMGEHYRYTRDNAWAARVAPKLLLAVEYLLAWRERNARDDLRGRGYGLLEGKVADPEDPFHSFMLNGYAYLGLLRVAEMLEEVDPANSARVLRETRAFHADLRRSISENLVQSPVVPLGDGSWCPTLGPWAEARGPVALLTDAERWATHGAFTVRDSLIGPLYLILSEVLNPEEQLSTWLLDYHADLLHTRNVAMSQPYYSPHPWAHVRRGEVKAFLKEYYSAMAGLADRETYSFWEHFWYVSPHKTHEEAWFLMRTRWMLYLEVGDTLKLLPGVPRDWLSHGKTIELDRVASYFGPLTLRVDSHLDEGYISAQIDCAGEYKPARVTLRLPHPDGASATSVTDGARYDSAGETVHIDAFTGHAEIILRFDARIS